MPITLELTDDQALDIVSQVSRQLSSKTGYLIPQTTPYQSHATNRQKVIDHINKKNVNEIFSVAQIQAELSMPHSSSISNTFRILKDAGVLKMIRRGTWKKI